jgi:hypothetical protein
MGGWRGICVGTVEPNIVIKDELAISIDIEAWDLDIPFGFEVEAFDVCQVNEGLYAVSDSRAVILGKGLNNVFNDVLCIYGLPNGLYHSENAGVIAHFETFDCEEEVWMGGVQFCDLEGDC